MELQPRSKKGQPPHSTAGVASRNSSHTAARGAIGAELPKSPAIAKAKSGTDSPTHIQNRRVMSRSSGLAAAPPTGVIGSRAMPQIGQLPGAGRWICGCIGQVHSSPAAVVFVSSVAGELR
jgi:hypothetical protein